MARRRPPLRARRGRRDDRLGSPRPARGRRLRHGPRSRRRRPIPWNPHIPTSWSWSGLRAWLVHAYTATGAVLALLIVLAAVRGDVSEALWLGLAALIIDGTDGMLARRFDVKARLPWFDGALLDNIVDYLTYVFAPVVLLLQGGYLPGGTAGTVVAVLPLLASTYQFCRVDAKTDDHFFLGFPSYWNVVAFYVIALDLGTTATTTTIVVCAALVFVPIGYLYPSRMLEWRRLTLVLSLLWAVSYAAIVVQLPHPDSLLLAASALYLVYYFGMSFHLEAKRRSLRRGAARLPSESAL